MTARLAAPLLVLALAAFAACTSDEAPTALATASVATATPTPTPLPARTPALVPAPTPPDDLAPEIPEGVPLMAPQAGAPSDLLDEDGWPLGAVGPLVVYERLVRDDVRRATGDDYGVEQTVMRVIEVVTYDLGAGREIAVLELGARGQPRPWLAGSKLVVDFGRQLWSTASTDRAA